MSSTGCTYNAEPQRDKLFDMFYGAWLGRTVGCILGNPHERYPYGSGDGERDGRECIKEWQIGSFMGALLGSSAVPEYLSNPLNYTLYSCIIDFHPASIKGCAERTYKLYLNK